MRDKIIDKIMIQINQKNNLDEIKYQEVRYGLQSCYTLITKTFIIILISLILHFCIPFIIFLIFYSILRSVGYGCHAKSNIMCWFFSTILLIGIPYIFNKIIFKNNVLIILWIICFINFLIFCPADTEKRPMINKKRKLIFKMIILIISLIYLVIIIKFNSISNLVVSAMILEALLTNPLGYILMGQKPRFKLSDINLIKQIEKEV